MISEISTSYKEKDDNRISYFPEGIATQTNGIKCIKMQTRNNSDCSHDYMIIRDK